ncbi:DUF1622 domain-containing protein [Variovorax sp. J22R133]|uniref:DUF1622 domain-containing protein n=1 Tax=Variovorax brevis TaxID=3053503 RepID=UPI002576B11F|nr:DUF1622 domain-containing protein [Variovorax sp. J22R133]MDM0114965.1 DUF1622 domain-containing protein [Variovorax sp. J22R133]
MDLEALEASLHEFAHFVALAVEACAVLFIAVGAIAALYRIVTGWFELRHETHEMRSHMRRGVWLSFAHWLVAALTFQLAADVINTSFSPTWEELGHLGAIAVIRTFLNYFLGREMEEKKALQEDYQKRPS